MLFSYPKARRVNELSSVMFIGRDGRTADVEHQRPPLVSGMWYGASLGSQKTCKHNILRVLGYPIYKYLR